MSMLVGELYAHLSLSKKEFSAALKEAQLEAETSGRSIGTSLAAIGKVAAVGLLAVAAGAALVAFEGAKMATEFQHSMELVQTQAGASAEEVHHLSEAILGMAGSVGTAPDKLAEGIYHIESAGLRGEKALKMLETAALGAKVGSADLEATTNALVAEINSGIKGVTGMSDAMGTLNAIVGNGNMRMDDLTAAMSTGVLSVAKQFGISIQSVGASLATMTDQGIPAVDAATKLKSALFNLYAPSGATKKAFEAIGLTTTDLAKELASPRGIVGALQMLKDHLKGIDPTEAGQLLASAFGKRAGPAVMLLVNSLDMVSKKEADITEGAGHFQEAVDAMKNTTQFKIDQMGASFAAIGIQIGNTVLPAINDLVDGITALLKSKELQDVFKGIGDAAMFTANALGAIVGVVGGIVDFLNSIGATGPIAAAAIDVLAVAIGIGLVTAIAGVVAAAAPIILTIGAIVAGVALLEAAFENVGTSIPEVMGAIAGAVVSVAKGIVGSLLNIVGTLVGILASFPNPLQDWAKETQASLDEMRHSVDQWGVDLHSTLGDIGGSLGKIAHGIFGVDIPQAALDGMGKTIGNVKDALTGGRYAIKNGVLVMLEEAKPAVTEGGKDLATAAGKIGMDMGETMYDEFGDEIVVDSADVQNKTLSLMETFGTSLKGVMAAVGSGAGASAMTEMAKGIASARQAPMDEFDTLKQMMKTSLSPTKELMRNLGILMSKRLAAGLKDGRPDVRAQAEGVMLVTLERIRAAHPTLKSLGKRGMELLKEGMHSKNKDVKAAATEIYNSVVHPISKVTTLTKSWGAAAVENFIAGLESKEHHLQQVASRLAGAMGDYLKVSSPSKLGVMSTGGGPEGWGRRVGLLFAQGLSTSLPGVGGVLASGLGGGLQMPLLALAGATGAATGGVGAGKMGDVHYHYEVKTQGLVKARDPFEIASAMRRVSTVTASGLIGSASYNAGTGGATGGTTSTTSGSPGDADNRMLL